MMDDQEKLSAAKNSLTPIQVRILRTLLLTFLIAVIGLIYFVLAHIRVSGGIDLSNIMPILILSAILLVLFLIIPIFICLSNLIKSEQKVFFGVLLILLMIISCGVMGLIGDEVWIGFGISLASFLGLFMVFYRLPLFIFGLFIVTNVFCFCWQLMPTLIYVSNAVSQSRRGMEIGGFFFIFGILVLITGFLFACAYLPRGIEWKRYFFPYSNRPLFFPDEKKNKGFTLIELLIVVAMIGIVTGGTLHCWASILQTHKQLQIRTFALEILNSEMMAVMDLSPFPDPSPTAIQLPITLEDFVSPYSFDGDYVLEESETPGIVKITIRLKQKVDSVSDRNYRLVGYRQGKAQKP